MWFKEESDIRDEYLNTLNKTENNQIKKVSSTQDGLRSIT
jgi:hypothetical protein